MSNQLIKIDSRVFSFMTETESHSLFYEMWQWALKMNLKESTGASS